MHTCIHTYIHIHLYIEGKEEGAQGLYSEVIEDSVSITETKFTEISGLDCFTTEIGVLSSLYRVPPGKEVYCVEECKLSEPWRAI